MNWWDKETRNYMADVDYGFISSPIVLSGRVVNWRLLSESLPRPKSIMMFSDNYHNGFDDRTKSFGPEFFPSVCSPFQNIKRVIKARKFRLWKTCTAQQVDACRNKTFNDIVRNHLPCLCFILWFHVIAKVASLLLRFFFHKKRLRGLSLNHVTGLWTKSKQGIVFCIWYLQKHNWWMLPNNKRAFEFHNICLSGLPCLFVSEQSDNQSSLRSWFNRDRNSKFIR